MEEIKDRALSTSSPTDTHFLMIQTAETRENIGYLDLYYVQNCVVCTHSTVRLWRCSSTSLFPTVYAEYIWVTLLRGIKGGRLISESDAYDFCGSACIQVRFKVLIHDWRIECGPYGLYSMGCDCNAGHVDPDGRAKTALYIIRDGAWYWCASLICKNCFTNGKSMILKTLHTLWGQGYLLWVSSGPLQWSFFFFFF